ncbi:MAG: methyltransferase domain-containing protein [Acidobacteriota bacterium]|jgi:ubiquinone/menaquinone biosynthesis C-methylase UbiE
MRGVEQIPWAYDAFMTLVEAGGFGRWRRWLAAGAGGRTLDVGTGTGRNLPLFPESAQVVALEPDLRMLARARDRAGGQARGEAGGRRTAAWLVVGDVMAMPFADAAFDTAVSGVVFCSVAEPLRGLAEVRRVLRPGGELRMMEHVRHHRPWLARLQDWVQPAWTVVAGGCHPNRDTEAAVVAAGFEIDASSRRAEGVMRRFVARPVASAAPPAAP